VQTAHVILIVKIGFRPNLGFDKLMQRIAMRALEKALCWLARGTPTAWRASFADLVIVCSGLF
jgi:hypothetical protein